ncbi:MAG: hypothetical protein HKN82_15755 [Akkermansiaceae bacterium]|nr:hypothetical protein [Akkermansiaceae bacterium]NNM30898.1 hypothetical protein [Akkermansiaceae bacterium]
MSSLIAVSPWHSLEIPDGHQELLERPREEDFVLRTLLQREVNGQPLVSGDLVIAGRKTLEAYPLAEQYPVHFRKSYYPICFFQDPAGEEERQLAVSRVEGLHVAPPIGSNRTTFRSCFVPGIPFDRVTPFTHQPEVRNIDAADETPLLTLIGLWNILVELHRKLGALHAAGIAHGDAELHNAIVTPAPAGIVLIDFEKALMRDDAGDDKRDWEETRAADLREVSRQAIYCQCGLGRQTGPLAEEARAELEGGHLLGDPAPFLRAMRRRGA